MKKIFLLLFLNILFCLAPKTYAQQVLRIDFCPGSSGDYDLYLKQGFEKLGYKVFINYYNRKADLPYDLKLTYEDLSYYQAAKNITLTLYNANNEVLKTAKYEPFFIGGNPVRPTFQAIEKITGKSLDLEAVDKEMFTKTKDGMNYFLEKTDSNSYIIIARCSYNNTYNKMKEMLLAKADLLLQGRKFEYYLKNSLYSHIEVVGMNAYSYVNLETTGFIQPINHSDSCNKELSDYPKEYHNYIETQYAFLDTLVKVAPSKDDKANLYFIRSTGTPGSLGRFPVFIDGKRLDKIGNNRYLLLQIDPGTHQIASRSVGKKPKATSETLELNLEAGKTYYVQLLLESNFVVNVYCKNLEPHIGKILMFPLQEQIHKAN